MTELRSKLISQLSIIAPYIEEMDALLYIVQNTDIDDGVLQTIEQIIDRSYKLVESEEKKQLFEQSLLLIKEIQAQELQDAQKDAMGGI